MDDIIITGTDITKINSIIHSLQHSFALKDLGILSYFLGIEATWCKNGLLLSQSKYIQELLHKSQIQAAKPISTPSCVTTKL